MSITMPLPDTLPEQGVIRKKMSYEEYMQLSDKPKAEWVDGTAIIQMSPQARPNNKFAVKLGAQLLQSLPNLEVLSEQGLNIARSYRVPDIMVLDPATPGNMWITDSPILLVEILSKSTWREDLGPKVDEYLTIGAQNYWTVDPEVKVITLRTNVNGQWQITAVLDESNPQMDVQLGNHGIVKLRLAELFS